MAAAEADTDHRFPESQRLHAIGMERRARASVAMVGNLTPVDSVLKRVFIQPSLAIETDRCIHVSIESPYQVLVSHR